jgi:hypothetical protein
MAFTYSKLAEVTVGATAVATIDFNNIPQNYTDLKIVLSLRSDVNSVEALVMNINGSSANFTSRFIDSGAGTPRTGTAKVDGIVNGTDYTASTFSSNEIYIPNYTSSNFKSYSVDYVTENNASAGYNGFDAGLWSNVTAITSLSFRRANSGSLVQHSTATLYGVKVEV